MYGGSPFDLAQKHLRVRSLSLFYACSLCQLMVRDFGPGGEKISQSGDINRTRVLIPMQISGRHPDAAGLIAFVLNAFMALNADSWKAPEFVSKGFGCICHPPWWKTYAAAAVPRNIIICDMIYNCKIIQKILPIQASSIMSRVLYYSKKKCYIQ